MLCAEIDGSQVLLTVCDNASFRNRHLLRGRADAADVVARAGHLAYLEALCQNPGIVQKVRPLLMNRSWF